MHRTNLFKQFNRFGFRTSKRGKGLLCAISPSDREYLIDERILDLSLPHHDKKVKILKSDWNYKLPVDLYIALIILIEGMRPAVYLIPSDVFVSPDNYIFFDNEQSERFKDLSNWELKIFGKGIEKLSEYAFSRVIKTMR